MNHAIVMQDKFVWCLEKKQGIKLVEPNENLMKDYFHKAELSLDMMKKAGDNLEWKISSGYYAMYYSAYALLMMAGIKSELHSCTIEAVKQLFKSYFREQEIAIFEKAKDLRVRVQYYIVKQSEITNYAKNILFAEKFHFKCKSIARSLDKKTIASMRAAVINRTDNALKEKRL